MEGELSEHAVPSNFYEILYDVELICVGSDGKEVFDVGSDDEEVIDVRSGEKDVFDVKLEDEDVFDAKSDDKDVFDVKSEDEDVFDVKSKDEDVFDAKSDDKDVFDVKSEDEDVFDVKSDDKEKINVGTDDEEMIYVGSDDEEVIYGGSDDEEVMQMHNDTYDEEYVDPLKLELDEGGQPVNLLSIFDEYGTPLSWDSPAEAVVEPVVIVGERGRGRGDRGRGRRARGGRGGGRAGVPSRASGADAWQRGNPIREIYVNDDDVPEELRAAIVNVYMKREARQRIADRRRAATAEEGEEYYDADDGGDAALFSGDEDALRFDWCPMDTFQGERESFLPQKTGPTAASGSAFEAFSQYWDESILTHIVKETNRYAVTFGYTDWYDTNVHEILVLFAFWMMLGIIRMPSIRSCFSEHFLLKTTCFRLMFSSRRFQRLCSVLHFNDDSLLTRESSKLFSIEPILSHLNARFQAAYIPRQEICIDESLVLWKGKLSIRQHIKTKAAKYGIKTFELCESATGYLWSFFVYTGKDSHPDPSLPVSLLKSTASVLKLIRPLLNKGYTLFMDNWFNSPLLARFLKRNRTDVVGTLRTNRQDVPPLITQCTLEAGQFTARHSGDMMVMAYHDRKKIALLSTYHGKEVAQSSVKPYRPTLWKPQLVLDYNKNMGGVDLKDGMLETYLLERKRCAKWYMKLFKRLLNCSILNSRICYEATRSERIEHIVFRLELVEQIIKNHLSLIPKPRHLAPKPERFPDQHFTQNSHWPTSICKRDAKGRIMRRCCAIKSCDRRTTFECKFCDVGLCVELCFGRYHNRP